MTRRPKYQRAFLKWAGGKASSIDILSHHLPNGNRFIEPFVGAGTVFLNTDFKQYILNDINQDLINLFNAVKDNVDRVIEDSRTLFVPSNNTKSRFLSLRRQFNVSGDLYERAILFLYLNRHCYNGLCRYNKKGGFNTSFGDYKSIYFPEEELLFFAEKAQRAIFTCEHYASAFNHANKNSVIYCDPPYVPLSDTAKFTSYTSMGFGLPDHAYLAVMAHQISHSKQVPVLISNHDTPFTRYIYAMANSIETISINRKIGCKNRAKVIEMLALYDAPLHHKGNVSKVKTPANMNWDARIFSDCNSTPGEIIHPVLAERKMQIETQA